MSHALTSFASAAEALPPVSDSPAAEVAELPAAIAAPDVPPSPTIASSVAPPIAPRDLIDRAHQLPPGLRAQLAAAFADAPVTHNDQGEPVVPLAAALSAFESALPDTWRSGVGPCEAAAHPGGEAFFDGNDAGPTERRAEEIARRQLERTGYLRDA